MEIVALAKSRRRYYLLALMGIASIPGLVLYCLVKLGLNVGGIILASLSVLTLCWIGWEAINLVKNLKEFGSELDGDSETHFHVARGSFLERLAGKMNVYVKKQDQCKRQMQEQLETLNIQVQLSQRQARNTEAIIQSIHDAVIVTDSFNRVVVANQRASELFSFDLSNSQYKEVSELLGVEKVAAMIMTAISSKTHHRRNELEIEVAGETKYFNSIFSSITDGTGEIVGVVSVFHDISREKEVSQMKNEFVSHVSHELKTPLASITAYAEMLVDGEAQDDETKEQFLSIIQNQAQRLNRLIEDILSVSRIESGLVKVKKENASVALLIRDSFEMIKSFAADKNITVTQPSSVVYDQVRVDKDMISQVIINLLSNAVKYTQPGGDVRIEAEVLEDVISVKVIDSGVGIPAADIDRVFDKFYRVIANNKVAKGTGLGLNLVRQIVEKVHSGRVFVESVEGHGSTFGFELPLCNNKETVATNQ